MHHKLKMHCFLLRWVFVWLLCIKSGSGLNNGLLLLQPCFFLLPLQPCCFPAPAPARDWYTNGFSSPRKSHYRERISRSYKILLPDFPSRFARLYLLYFFFPIFSRRNRIEYDSWRLNRKTSGQEDAQYRLRIHACFRAYVARCRVRVCVGVFE